MKTNDNKRDYCLQELRKIRTVSNVFDCVIWARETERIERVYRKIKIERERNPTILMCQSFSKT